MGVHYIEPILGKAVAVVLVLIVSAVCVLAVLTVTETVTFHVESVQNVVNTGTLTATDGILVDKASINWGELIPDSNATETISVTNDLSQAVQLYLTASNWTPPEVADVLTLSWNYSGAAVDSKETVIIALTLTVAEDIGTLTDFSFDIIITGVT